MTKIIEDFKNRRPLLVIKWSDAPHTDAQGWLAINSLDGDACGGGIRMSPTVSEDEVVALAKTMQIKFGACQFWIGGAKSGICFDPRDPRKSEVLKRFFTAIKPYLKEHYGTGGDLSVDISEITPILSGIGITHPQYGTAWGKYGSLKPHSLNVRLERLRKTGLVVESKKYAPDSNTKFTYADLITGFGVAEATTMAFGHLGTSVAGKKILIQGFGVVGAAAAYYLAGRGAHIAGILEHDKVLLPIDETLSFEEVTRLFVEAKRGRPKLNHPETIPIEHVSRFWRTKVDAFLPCAGSKLVTLGNITSLINNTVQNHKDKLVVVCGANNAFAEKEPIYGTLTKDIDCNENVLLVPDFVANLGMARLFYFLMNDLGTAITPENAFSDISRTIYSHFIGDAPATEFTKYHLERILSGGNAPVSS